MLSLKMRKCRPDQVHPSHFSMAEVSFPCALSHDYSLPPPDRCPSISQPHQAISMGLGQKPRVFDVTFNASTAVNRRGFIASCTI